jgi:hypothetical protein
MYSAKDMGPLRHGTREVQEQPLPQYLLCNFAPASKGRQQYTAGAGRSKVLSWSSFITKGDVLLTAV